MRTTSVWMRMLLYMQEHTFIILTSQYQLSLINLRTVTACVWTVGGSKRCMFYIISVEPLWPQCVLEFSSSHQVYFSHRIFYRRPLLPGFSGWTCVLTGESPDFCVCSFLIPDPWLWELYTVVVPFGHNEDLGVVKPRGSWLAVCRLCIRIIFPPNPGVILKYRYLLFRLTQELQ